jgi:hypothetical protein
MTALIRSWSATPETKAMLDDMRCNSKSQWHALVRQCRIRSSPTEIGVADFRSRKKAVLEATQIMSQAFGVRDTSEILWFTRARFLAHQVYVEGISGATLEEKEAAAAAKWTRDLSNLDILRRGSGLDVQLGVVGIPRTEGFRVRESKRTVTCADTLHSKLQMEVAMHALAEHGTTSHALTSRAMGDFGAVFQPGMASSSSHTMLQSLPACSVTPPLASTVCDAAALEPPRGFSGMDAAASRKRNLHRGPSDPLKRAKGGVTGELLAMRNEALACIKDACTNYGSVNKNMAKRWQALCKAQHVTESTAPPEMARWVDTFTNTLTRLKGDIKMEITTWTLSSAPARLARVRSLVVELDALATSMAVHVTALEDRVKNKRKSEHKGSTQRDVRACQTYRTLAQCAHGCRGTSACMPIALHA